MFDWQAELAPFPTPAAIPSSNNTATLLVSTHVLSAPIAAPVQTAKPSFAQALRGTLSIADPLPLPSIRGETLSVAISTTAYSRGVDYCKINLCGRLVLNKGDKPYATKDITAKLQRIWTVKGPWHMLSLGRGFYEFFFASQEDMRSVWPAGTVSLKSGLLRLFEWTKDFNLHTQRQTHTQVWIRLWELPQEYWTKRTLYEIAGAVGTPLLIDNVTRNRLYGHYARILVDLDLSKKVFYEVMVEREGFAFPVSIEYEGLPDFCTHCHSIDHNINSCRRLHPHREDDQPLDVGKKIIDNCKKSVHSRKPKETWKPKDNPEGIWSSKAFASADIGQQHDVPPPEIVLLDNDITAPTQQHASVTESQELAAAQHTDGTYIAAEMTNKDVERTIPNDATQMVVPLISANKELEVTYTFEAHSEATKNCTERLPNTFIHVLEEINVDENIDMAEGGIE